jgi:hypothetical protein
MCTILASSEGLEKVFKMFRKYKECDSQETENPPTDISNWM